MFCHGRVCYLVLVAAGRFVRYSRRPVFFEKSCVKMHCAKRGPKNNDRIQKLVLRLLPDFCVCSCIIIHYTRIPRHGKGPENVFFRWIFSWRKIFRWLVRRVYFCAQCITAVIMLAVGYMVSMLTATNLVSATNIMNAASTISFARWWVHRARWMPRTW